MRMAPAGLVVSPGMPWELLQVLHKTMGDWTEATYSANFLGTAQETELVYVNSSGVTVHLDAPNVDEVAARLRRESYTPHEGPWFRIQVNMKSSGSPVTALVYERLPEWKQPVPDSAYREELELFPRDDAAIPDWLREKAGRGSAAPVRIATPFDGWDQAGKPVVTRDRLADEEAALVLAYLKAGPLAGPPGSLGEDAYAPGAPACVPSAFATDGTWVWPGSVTYYLERYGLPPQGELLEHIRRRNYTVPPVPAQTMEAIRAYINSDRALEDARAILAAQQGTPA